jgi:hypothetical protein
LDHEVLQQSSFKTQAEAPMAVFEWIVGWYNPIGVTHPYIVGNGATPPKNGD